MLDTIEREIIGIYADAEGNSYDVVEEARWVKYRRLSGPPARAPGTKNYVTACGIQLNPLGSNTDGFCMVLSGVDIWRVCLTE